MVKKSFEILLNFLNEIYFSYHKSYKNVYKKDSSDYYFGYTYIQFCSVIIQIIDSSDPFQLISFLRKKKKENIIKLTSYK